MNGGGMIITTNKETNLEFLTLVNAPRGYLNHREKTLRKSNRPWCDNSRKPGHIKDKLWHIHDKPTNYKKKRSF